MASSRFVKFTKADIYSFSAKQENVKTKKKTSYDVKLFKEFLGSVDETREIEENTSPLAARGRDKVRGWSQKVLFGGREPSTSAGISASFPRITVDEITATSTVQPGTKAGALPFFYQCQVGTVNIFTTLDQKRGEFEQKQVEWLSVTVTKANKQFFHVHLFERLHF